MSNPVITFRVNVGSDGAWKYEGTDYEEAHRIAREISDRAPIFQGRVFSSRSGLIAVYQGGELAHSLQSDGTWTAY